MKSGKGDYREIRSDGAVTRVAEGSGHASVVGDYERFLASKFRDVEDSGFDFEPNASALFPFQRDLVRWGTRRGKAAIFADTGLGKSRMQIEWARGVVEQSGGDVLILAPLAVGAQTVREARNIGVAAVGCREPGDVRPGINVTNYDRLHKFDPSRFTGVVLDESSCIKHHDAKSFAQLLRAFGDTPYRLCATATPSPNDYSELGTHAEFLGICSRAEMLAEFFVHDSGETQTWRLKKHARAPFWRWVAAWGALVRKPSDLGYADDGYDLPELVVEQTIVGGGVAVLASTLAERREARKASMEARVRAVADLIAQEPDEQWLVWGDYNAETEGVARTVPDALEVRGPDDPDEKAGRLLGFANGAIKVLVSKPSIAGWGMNFQRCARIAFVGIGDSFEAYYQAVRRCWRFGQRRPVHVHVFSSKAEGAVVDNLKRKEEDARRMAEELSAHTRAAVRENVRGRDRRHALYEPGAEMQLPAWMRRTS